MLLDPAKTDLSKHFDWYENRLDSLFQIPGNSINGLALLGPDGLATRFNYLNAVSRFFSSAVVTDLPSMPEAADSLINCAAEHWSVAGEAFIVGSNNNARCVRPDYVYPITDPYDKENVTGYLFVYPYRDPRNAIFTNAIESAMEARVIEYNVETGTAREAIRKYTTYEVEDTPKGEAVDIGNVYWIRTGPAVYPPIASIVREVCVRLNMLQLALNTTSLPLIQINKDRVNDGALNSRQLTLDLLAELARGPLGINVQPPFSGEGEARYIERSGNGLDESLDYVRMLLGQLGILSGVPDYIFGVQTNKPDAETERVLFAAQARVNEFRKKLNAALSDIGFRDITFSSNPFTTRSERVDLVVRQLEAGIISVEESRDLLGIS